MKVASSQGGLTVKSSVPAFKYKFKKADDPIEMPKEHAEKVLRNKTFYEFGKATRKTKKASEKGDGEKKEETQ